MNAILFLALRAMRVLFAAVWIGSTVYISWLLTPAVEDAGAAGGQIRMRLDRRGAHRSISHGDTEAAEIIEPQRHRRFAAGDACVLRGSVSLWLSCRTGALQERRFFLISSQPSRRRLISFSKPRSFGS